jgi:hypothetical protein
VSYHSRRAIRREHADAMRAVQRRARRLKLGPKRLRDIVHENYNAANLNALSIGELYRLADLLDKLDKDKRRAKG